MFPYIYLNLALRKRLCAPEYISHCSEHITLQHDHKLTKNLLFNSTKGKKLYVVSVSYLSREYIQ